VYAARQSAELAGTSQPAGRASAAAFAALSVAGASLSCRRAAVRLRRARATDPVSCRHAHPVKRPCRHLLSPEPKQATWASALSSRRRRTPRSLGDAASARVVRARRALCRGSDDQLVGVADGSFGDEGSVGSAGSLQSGRSPSPMTSRPRSPLTGCCFQQSGIHRGGARRSDDLVARVLATVRALPGAGDTAVDETSQPA
jgi:hypothetical protein